MPNYNRIGVVVIFTLLLVSVIRLSPQIMGNDVRELLEVRVSEIETELESKKEQIRSLKQTIKLKDTQSDKTKEEIVTFKKKLEEKEGEISKTSKELQELNKKYQDKVVELEKSTTTVGNAKKVNDRLFKTVFNSKNPEYQKVIYTTKDINTDLNELIIMTSIGIEQPFGENRKFDDYLNLIESMEMNLDLTTLGLLIGTKSDFEIIQKTIEAITDRQTFSKIVLIQSEFIESLHKVDRDSRHSPSVQKERRRSIARARNFLAASTLSDETYALCLDSDMIELPKDMVTTFVASKYDIVTPRIKHDRAANYDFNAWKGGRTEPNEEQSKLLDNNDPAYSFVPGRAGSLSMGDFMKKEHGNDGSKTFSVQLDSVGGAVLFLKTEILKQGVTFPPYYVVGTKWGRYEGFDGIETEGLCYQARSIGYKCWGMPNVVAKHIVDLH